MNWLFSSPLLHQDLALFLLRQTLGWFFLLARFRWVWSPDKPQTRYYRTPWRGVEILHITTWNRWFNKERHDSLCHKMGYCGLSTHPLLAAFVAISELLAALALIFGLLTWIAAAGLVILLLVATHCTAKEKTMRQNPVDRVDVVSCYLWTPEPVYLTMAIVLAIFGGGAWSLDALAMWVLQ